MKLLHLSGTQLDQPLYQEPFCQMVSLTLPATLLPQNETPILLMRRLCHWACRWIVWSHTANWVRVGDFNFSPPVFKDCIQHPDEPHQKPSRASLFHYFCRVATDTAGNESECIDPSCAFFMSHENDNFQLLSPYKHYTAQTPGPWLRAILCLGLHFCL